MEGYELAVMRAVETADKRTEGHFEGSEKLYARNLGPARWLVVVVAYAGRTGRVRTAYPQTKEPKTG